MQITLNTGRRISLVQLHQWRTYHGMLAGIPHRAMNETHFNDAMAKARELFGKDSEPFLLRPAVTPIPPRKASELELKRKGMTAEQHAAQQAKMHYERLPSTTCIGVFDSNELARPGSEPYSSLTVVWFQEDFAPPLDAAVLDQVRRLDWDVLAMDWNW